ncbi:alpha/beta fold hydrolase [Cohnella lupini]|uniref:Pimeloyl-ACP methyl ester carboxylesterase n=1 Tax=Cohnella lupini TaxID=1294267 RepID=A0A3D9I8V1_9BACL|nr:alpha/beta hydrolase [Cohnella lupini]RED58157.1 pimeloyl-ACP methyl ester carboxylesterase [Cohnella lupini]
MSNGERNIGIVFIHGAGLDGRVWDQVAQGLDIPCLQVEFPKGRQGMDSRRGLSLDDYVAGVQRQIENWGVDRFVIVAHSLGGVVGLQVANRMSDRVVGFVAVGAAIPNKFGSFLSTLPLPKRLLMSLILRTVGTKPPESAIRAGLCGDLSKEQADEVVKGFIPESVKVYTDSVVSALPSVPKLYVKLNRDREFGQALQEKMIRNLSTERTVRLDTGHLPMLSDPDSLRAIIRDFVSESV